MCLSALQFTLWIRRKGKGRGTEGGGEKESSENRVGGSFNSFLSLFMVSSGFLSSLTSIINYVFPNPCLHITLLLTNLPSGCVLLVDAFISSSSFRSISSSLSFVLSSSLFHSFKSSL